ncbi:endolytic transglycosylase MltG [Sphingomonas sp. PL-96]|uniref:endolytic transglycosylase MltG n=1 Tax=Sphingomonas sp. PL-96 TaxID=2887201 RepID=UPI001E3AAB9B|nr:endolytic transglycosylase MltG [Sphingomonas sp. PL-96]MCC2975968.1 endolytic transglycosylase MltG [Sphingomonas sp. PL-96]
MRRLGCLGMVLALVLLVTLFGVARSWTGAGPAEKDLAVVVPNGATLSRAATELEKAGAIRSASRFLLFARVLGSDAPIRAGEYRVPAQASQSDVLELLQSGKVIQRRVTVPEGMPSVLVHEALMRAPHLTGTVAVPEEGSVLPDTYDYQRGDTRQAVLDRMQAAMRDYLAAAWKRRKPTAVVRSPREALTLASIVEKETAKAAERRAVAAVYSNRLRQGMPLQADPTVIYPVTKGRPLGRRILRSELDAKNGYNTYASAGLPVGPIANPGRASIDAVLDPAATSALYFVADGTGGHVFADTLEQHNANVRKWYAIRRARGEM